MSKLYCVECPFSGRRQIFGDPVRGLGDNAPLIRTLTDKFAGHFPKVRLCDEGHIQGRTRPARVNCGPEEPPIPRTPSNGPIWPRVSHPGSFLFERPPMRFETRKCSDVPIWHSFLNGRGRKRPLPWRVDVLAAGRLARYAGPRSKLRTSGRGSPFSKYGPRSRQTRSRWALCMSPPRARCTPAWFPIGP